MHLSPDELVDIAEGTRPPASAPHLADCDRCRRQVEELRAMMAVVDRPGRSRVPEPAPLFWDRLSQRVQGAVEAEGAPRRHVLGDLGRLARLGWLRRPQILVPATALIAAAIALAVRFDVGPLPTPTPTEVIVRVAAPADPLAAPSRSLDLLNALDGDQDPSLRLVAELSQDLDWDSASEAGLSSRGSAEHAVTHLDAGELRELGRLLREQLAKPGA